MRDRWTDCCVWSLKVLLKTTYDHSKETCHVLEHRTQQREPVFLDVALRIGTTSCSNIPMVFKVSDCGPPPRELEVTAPAHPPINIYK